MAFSLYSFFHNETNDRTEHGLVAFIPENPKDWPDSWKRIVTKKYSFFKSIKLHKINGYFFENLLSKRVSSLFNFSSNKITLSDIAYILRCSYGLQENISTQKRQDNRTVPSGGKRYPLEVYFLCFKKIDNLLPGVYHYGVNDNVLEPVLLVDFSVEDIISFSPQESLQKSNGMFCITSFFERSVIKYGSRAYRYILLEAGHVGQNILLSGTERGLNIIPIGRINEGCVEAFMGLNQSTERVIYTLFI